MTDTAFERVQLWASQLDPADPLAIDLEEVLEGVRIGAILTDSKNHIEEAHKLLTGEVWRGTGKNDMEQIDGMCVIVMDLDRVDCAIGPRGESIFAAIAQKIQATYVEITAAKKSLDQVNL